MIELQRSVYKTWIVRKDGIRVYETTNKIKAEGVIEYLRKAVS
jgi:hypothetical protein